MSFHDAFMFWLIVLVVAVFVVAALVEICLQLAGSLRRASRRRLARPRQQAPSAMDQIGADLSRLDRLDGLGRELR